MLSAELLRKSRPENLPEVEPELREDPPRTTVWYGRSGKRFSDETERLFQTFRALTGWVARVDTAPAHEGPDYHLWFGYELGTELRQHYQVVGYDTYHWAVGDPESFDWFHRVMKPGHPVTLLISPDASTVAVYGLCEPWIYTADNSLVWAAR